jgi:hypothetical protein
MANETQALPHNITANVTDLGTMAKTVLSVEIDHREQMVINVTNAAIDKVNKITDSVIDNSIKDPVAKALLEEVVATATESTKKIADTVIKEGADQIEKGTITLFHKMIAFFEKKCESIKSFFHKKKTDVKAAPKKAIDPVEVIKDSNHVDLTKVDPKATDHIELVKVNTKFEMFVSEQDDENCFEIMMSCDEVESIHAHILDMTTQIEAMKLHLENLNAEEVTLNESSNILIAIESEQHLSGEVLEQPLES